MKRKWEIIKLVTVGRIEGLQLASMQFSQDEIIVFGSHVP